MLNTLKKSIKKIVKGAKKVMEEREAFKTKVYEDAKDIFKKENFVDIGIFGICVSVGLIVIGLRNKENK